MAIRQIDIPDRLILELDAKGYSVNDAVVSALEDYLNPQNIAIPRSLNILSLGDFSQKLRLAAAIYWYQKSEISQEKAAEIAGLNRRDFLAILAQEKIDVFVVDFDDL